MMWRDVVSLVAVSQEKNDAGDLVDTETTRTVFADRRSIRASEFYQAQASGLRPEIMFVVRYGEYQNEPILEHDGKRYNIIRTYSKNGEEIELVCQGIVNGVV